MLRRYIEHNESFDFKTFYIPPLLSISIIVLNKSHSIELKSVYSANNVPNNFTVRTGCVRML